MPRTRIPAPAQINTSAPVTAEPADKVAETTGPVVAKSPNGKLAVLMTALTQPAGATIAEMVAATGWQSHSVRGAISGSLKKKHGIEVTSAVVEGVRRYSVACATR